MASATRAWENQNWSSLTSTTTPAPTSGAEVGQQVGLVGLGDGEQGLERGRPPVDGERLDDAAAAVVEALDLLADGFLQRPRQLGVEQVGDDRPGPDDAHQLLDDERDPAAAPVQRLDERRRGVGAGGRGDRRDHRADLGPVEPLEAHLLDGVAALQAQHQLAAGLAAREVVGPVGGDDHEVRPRLLGDAVDEVGAGRVDPVEVLDDEHRRTAPRRRGDGVEHGVGQLVAGQARDRRARRRRRAGGSSSRAGR